MLIEFFGLPGTGKTTTMQILTARYPTRIRDLNTLPPVPGKRRGIFTAEFCAFFFKLLRLWIPKRRKERYDGKALYYFCSMYLTLMALRDRGTEDLYVTDHGLLQCLSSVVWDDVRGIARADALLRHIVRSFDAETSYVYLSGSDADTLYNRIIGRSNIVRLKSYDRASAVAVLTRQDALFEKAARYAAQGQLLRLDSRAEQNENAEKLCRYFNLKEV